MAPQAQLPEILRILAARMGGQAGGAVGGMPLPPIGAPGGTPPFQPRSPQQPAATSARPAYDIRNDPRAAIGSLQPPIPPRPPTQFEGSGPVGTLLSLLGNWHSSKAKNEQEEAARAAQDLMQAIEGGKASGDWTPAYTILHNNEKLFNKVYKGWLQKNELQAKESQKKQKEPEPDVQGFEQGVQQFLQKKQQGGAAPQGPPPQGSAPRSMGGYFMPQAGPQQALAQQATSAERQATQQDPARTLSTQLTSGETRQGELAKEGLAVTPKLQAELEKYQAEIDKAQLAYQKGQLDLQTAQQKAITTGKRDEAALKAIELKNQKAAIDLDIWRQKLANEQAKRSGLKSVSQSFQLKWQVIQRAENILKNVIANKGQIDKSNISTIASLLQSAGATKLASTLSDQQKSNFRPWLFSYSSPQEILDGLNEYKEAYKKAFIDAKEQASPTETDKETPEGADEGDTGETMDYEYDAEGNRVPAGQKP
jgi:hypothetical protein